MNQGKKGTCKKKCVPKFSLIGGYCRHFGQNVARGVNDVTRRQSSSACTVTTPQLATGLTAFDIACISSHFTS